MKAIIDTPIWSVALRRARTAGPREEPIVRELGLLIDEGRAALIGPIRQEVLSGVRDRRQHLLLRDRLRAFRDLEIRREDYERAAEYFSVCRAAGIQGSHVGFLICAVSVANDMPVFTTDADFALYAKQLPLELHVVRGT